MKEVIHPACIQRGEKYQGIYACCGWNAGKLAYLLGCSVHFPYGNDDSEYAWTHSKERKGKLPRPINLGCRRRFVDPTALNYNSQNAVNKVSVLQRFANLGIPCPKLINPCTFEGRFLGRKNKSRSGRGIEIYNAGDEVGEHDFFVELLDCKAEHRIHIFNDKVLCELNKRLKIGEIIHTLEHGSPLIPATVYHPKKDEMVNYAVQAVKALNLDFGAVDVLVDVNDKIYILEVNSDPGMPGIIGYLYAEAFREYFGIDFDLGKFKTEDGREVNLDDKLFY